MSVLPIRPKSSVSDPVVAPEDCLQPRRRRLLQMAAGLAATPLWAHAAVAGGPERSEARTRSGRFAGQRRGATFTYLGIPYAQAPVGPLRFRSPKPYVAAGSTLIQADTFGPAALQTYPPYVTWIYPLPDKQDESCLTLNVWTPARARHAPVLVWLHGGAWRTGATSMPLMDGQALAGQGLVVVTVNYRLGSTGFLSHPAFTDPDSGLAGNWCLQDQAAALAWVRDNIEAFGGDPASVCVIGQSAGATNAALLAQHPEWSRLLHKAVLLSPAGIAAPLGFSEGDAAEYTELVAASLGTSPQGLMAVPAAKLHAAELAVNRQALPASFTSGHVFRAAPAQDGRSVRGDWTRMAWPEGIPLMVTNTLTEGSFFADLYDPVAQKSLTAPLPQSREALAALVAGPGLAGSPAGADAVIEAYAKAALAEARVATPGALYVEIYGDRLLRNFSARFADRVAGQGGQVYLGTYMHELQRPGQGVPHCAEVPMLFSTYALDYYRSKLGAGPAEQRVSQHVIAAVASFASGRAVGFADGSIWPAYRQDKALSARIAAGDGADVSIGGLPKRDQLAVWDALLGY